jgi:endonuclease/exonuclease/phosphatase (EEP) superfamily protein YafD
LLASLAAIYCAGVVVLAVLWLAGVRATWWLNLAQIFALYLCAPVLVLAPLAWRAGGARRRGAAAAGLLALVVLFGARLVPPLATPHSGAALRVATMNLHFAREGEQLASGLAAIRTQHADVVALQELSLPAAAQIQRDLAGDYPYQMLAPSETFTGTGLLSRYPLDALPGNGAAGQLAQLRLGGTSVALINVSLPGPEIKRRYVPKLGWVDGVGGYHTSKRTRALKALLAAVGQQHGPLVVAGDFNLSDREQEYEQLAAMLHDAYREAGWGFGHTFPSRLPPAAGALALPLIRIDYVWSAGGVAPAAADVACGEWSDHCMLTTELRVGVD